MTFFQHPRLPEQIGLQETLNDIQLETEYGRLALAELVPYKASESDQMKEAWEEIDSFYNAHRDHPTQLKEIRQLLHGVKNTRRFIKAAADEAVLSDVELFEIKKQAFSMERARQYLQRHRRLNRPSVQLEDVQWLIQLLDPEGTRIETFYLYDAYDEALKQVRKKKQQLEEEMLKHRKTTEKQVAKILETAPLWNGDVLISKAQPVLKDRMETLGTYTLSGETSQEWIYRQKTDPRHIEMENLLLEEGAIEHRVRRKLSADIGEKASVFLANTVSLGHLDLLIGKTMLAVRYQGCKPVQSSTREISIVEGRHPVLEKTLRQHKRKVMPISVQLHQGVTVVTGANMGGKTMALKMVALLTALAQLGFWVPAQAFAFYPVEWIYFSTGDEQSQALGLSTFGAEIYGLKKILDMTNQKGLVLLDELASGTNPKEGSCISRAIVDYLNKGEPVSLVTTHYDDVGSIPNVTHLQVVGLNRKKWTALQCVIEEKGWSPGLFEEAMDYRLLQKEPGSPVPKDAIAVAEIMGLNRQILKEARRLLELESEGPREA